MNRVLCRLKIEFITFSNNGMQIITENVFFSFKYSVAYSKADVALALPSRPSYIFIEICSYVALLVVANYFFKKKL